MLTWTEFHRRNVVSANGMYTEQVSGSASSKYGDAAGSDCEGLLLPAPSIGAVGLALHHAGSVKIGSSRSFGTREQ
jgi:hypothetical protein